MNAEKPAAPKYPQARLLAISGAVALLIVGLVFFDVIFLHRTLQPSNIVPQIGRPADWHAAAVFPSLNPHVDAGFGYGDLGATAWQSEPSRYLMARDFREGQSPFWNPYSAAGTLGPETLVDLKFSPFTLVSAYFFNASPTSFDLGLLVIYCVALFFVVLILHGHFRLSLLSALAGALVFLLNGFALPNLNSQNGQPYFFSPILLYALFTFGDKRTLLRWLGLMLAEALMLLNTLLLVLFAVHAMDLTHAWQKGKTRRSISRYFLLVGTAFVVAFLLVAPLWFPIVDSFFVGNMLTSYVQRPNQVQRDITNLLSVFTPKHFWENYSEILHATVYPDAGFSTDDNVIAHTGIIAGLAASYAVTRDSVRNNALIPVCMTLLLLCYLRVFGCLGFVDHLPILRSIAMQYFGSASAIALTLLVAHGIENILKGNTSSVCAIIVLALLVAAFAILYSRLGFVSALPYRRYLEIIIGLFVLCVAIVIANWLRPENRQSLALFVLALMTIELLFYMNTLRPVRYSPIAKQPGFVTFLKQHIGDGRVLNVGTCGARRSAP
jgi:hypothetical protein